MLLHPSRLRLAFPPSAAPAAAAAGFTLIELAIVIVLIAILAMLAIPHTLSSKVTANESAVVATLRTVLAAQAQFKQATVVDANGNGAGEYGYFAELSGTADLRSDEAGGTSARRHTPTLISAAFGDTSSAGTMQRAGYVFRMYLPDAANGFRGEAGGRAGAQGVSIGATNAETFWACYAWPIIYGNSGRHAYLITQGGELLKCANRTQRYSGLAKAPAPGTAGYLAPNQPMSGALAFNATAADGELWVLVQ
jgi:prepilin-type N-terminal cleavage/methylation domain-containing protein